MRWKIIVANSVIVIIVGILSFALLDSGLGDVLANQSERRSEAERAVSSATTRLSLDNLRLERWLENRAAEEPVRAVFESGTAQARSESATAQAGRLREELAKNRTMSGPRVSLVLFVDVHGVAIGRNDSNQMRGDDLGATYPTVKRALTSGEASSHLWLNRKRSEQLMASYAPVRNETGKVVGALIAASPLNDERLSTLSLATSGRSLSVGMANDAGTVEILAEGTRGGARSAFTAMHQESVLTKASESLRAGQVVFVEGELVFAARPLQGFDSTRIFLLAGMEKSLVPSVRGLLWPIFAVCFLGILLVVGVGTFLGNYISQPISELEDGLLSIINGRTNHRFEIEHPDLGGLVSRINSLLNALMGVPETDEEGRTSSPPGARYREAEGP